MKQLMRLRLGAPFLGILAATAIAGALTTGGCAGVKPGATTGTGGSTGVGGSIGTLPPINGLESLSVSPTSASVTLTANAARHADAGDVPVLRFRQRQRRDDRHHPDGHLAGRPQGRHGPERPRERERSRRLHDHRQERQLPGVGDADRDVLGQHLRSELQPDEQQQDRSRRGALGHDEPDVPAGQVVVPRQPDADLRADVGVRQRTRFARLNFQADRSRRQLLLELRRHRRHQQQRSAPGRRLLREDAAVADAALHRDQREAGHQDDRPRVLQRIRAGRIAVDQRRVVERRPVGRHLLLVDDPEPAQGDAGERARHAAHLHPARQGSDQRHRHLPLRLHQRDGRRRR